MLTGRMMRRTFVAGAGMLGLGGRTLAQPALPSSPIVLNVIDAAGHLTLMQPVIEGFRSENPKLISRATFSRATNTELPGKIKAQQDANRVDIDLVLCGYTGYAVGVEQGLWLQLLPDFASALPKLDEIYLDGARRLQALMKGQGVIVTYSPMGPFLEFAPKVTNVPTSAEELMAWARENKDRFIYARAPNSGPGQAFLMGLPYMLGDSDPRDPAKGWDKTWAYLKALGEYIEYYPSGTAIAMKELGEGTRDIAPTIFGFDILMRVLGSVPKDYKVAKLKNTHFVSDAHCWAIPKGVPADKIVVILKMLSYALHPTQQAVAYDQGYMYPGPAVKNVGIELAPEKSQAAIKVFGRPEYTEWIAETPTELPLTPEATQLAFRIWDETIGSAKHK